MSLEYLIVGIYLLVLIVTGVVFSRFSRTASDYVRAGAQGAWWLVGTSIIMAGISAFTFTGNGSAAYSAGPTFLVIYLANVIALAIGGCFLAGWFRQTRAHTMMDVVRARFGTAVEQFAVASNVLLQPLGASIQLWALAVFASTAFGFPLRETIVVTGLIVVFYATVGGKWAVLANDFVQGIILFPITILLAVLALQHIGGMSAFLGYFSDPRFARDYAWVKEPGQFPGDAFTAKWVVMIFVMQLYAQVSITQAGRFLAAKDGREARRAAWLAAVLMIVGTCVWFVPPMVARFLHADEINALAVGKPAESAYAFMAARLLPNGLMGVMIAAMFAATLSSMDAGLNEQAGIIVRNLIGRLRGALGRPALAAGREVLVCRTITVVLGAFVIAMSLILSGQEDFPLFEAYFVVATTVGIPLGFPLLSGLWIRRLPTWSYPAIFGSCLLPSLYALWDGHARGSPWTIQDRTVWIFAFGLGASILCALFARYSSPLHQERERQFFDTMRRPVDFAGEVGESRDHAQLVLLGRTVLVLAALLAGLLVLPNPWSGRLAIAGVVALTGAVGVGLLWAGRRAGARTMAAETPGPGAAQPETSSPAPAQKLDSP
jgi:Na+/proline symporter